MYMVFTHADCGARLSSGPLAMYGGENSNWTSYCGNWRLKVPRYGRLTRENPHSSPSWSTTIDEVTQAAGSPSVGSRSHQGARGKVQRCTHARAGW